jgi:hypothetical protein
MAIEGAVVVVLLIALSVLVWRQFTRTDRAGRRTRYVLAAYGVFTPLLTLTVAVVVAANAATAAHPVPGLKGFLAGGCNQHARRYRRSTRTRGLRPVEVRSPGWRLPA